ncbi:DUF2786 domain-containing protein [Actinomadura keratinilytica]
MGGSGRSGGGAGDSGGAGPETPVARALAAALYGGADDDAALDTGASLLAAADPDEAGRELLRRGEEYVRRAWERGWLPADLDREARRQELDPAARTALAELTAAELARYGNGLTPLWRRQLDALAAPAWAGTGGRDRFARATAVLQALRLLLRLPALEPLGPPPGGHPSGAAAAPPRTPGGEAPEDRMLGRIRALLAKAEATGYPPEAEALTAKAQELMARHSVDEAQLSAGRSGGADAPGARRISVDPPYETAKAILLDAVARANRCQAVWNEELAFSTVVGHEADLELAELLYTSLLVQAATAMSRAEAAQRAGGASGPRRSVSRSCWPTPTVSATGSPRPPAPPPRPWPPPTCSPSSPAATSPSPRRPAASSPGPPPPGYAAPTTGSAGTTAPAPPTGRRRRPPGPHRPGLTGYAPGRESFSPPRRTPPSPRAVPRGRARLRLRSDA